MFNFGRYAKIGKQHVRGIEMVPAPPDLSRFGVKYEGGRHWYVTDKWPHENPDGVSYRYETFKRVVQGGRAFPAHNIYDSIAKEAQWFENKRQKEEERIKQVIEKRKKEKEKEKKKVKKAEPKPKKVKKVSPVAKKAAEASALEKIRKRIAFLRAEIARKRAAKESKIAAVQEKLRKQAAYGRDIEQKRTAAETYATEAERAMGARTGYYVKPKQTLKGYFGSTPAEVEDASEQLRKAVALVKQVTEDVKAGVVPKSDLVKAMKSVEEKAARVKRLSAGLSGYGEEKSKGSIFIPLLIFGIIVWFFSTR
jgi:hypothetical protein